MAGSTEMKMGYKNAVGWGIATFVVSAAARAGLWYWQIGSVKKLSSIPVWTVAVWSLLPLLVYLAMYIKYSGMGKKNPRGLREIAKNNIWGMYLGSLAAIEILVGVIVASAVPGLFDRKGAYTALIVCCAVGAVVDIVLFVIGAKCFKPDQIQVS